MRTKIRATIVLQSNHVGLFDCDCTFWDKEIEKQTKIATHMDLWKYGQILIIQKSLTIKWLRFSKKIFIIWIYHLVLHYILNPNNKFEMWFNIKKLFWCFNQKISPYFFSKVHYHQQIIFLLINNHPILFIMIRNEVISLDPSPNY
jgi:hypothetical protein